MKKAEENFKYWLQNAEGEILADLIKIADDRKEIEQRFYKEIQFGTAGLRGKMGAGTNMMNIYTVGRAAAGLGKTLTKNKKVVIAYDNRKNSLMFAEIASEVLSAQGIKVYIFRELAPTPLLSFAVKELKCGAGIMITASHNSKEYNGFKCYGADGCQMTENAAAEVFNNMQDFDYFNLPAADTNQKEWVSSNLIFKYYDDVIKQCLHKDILKSSGLKVLYTPLNGTGAKPVKDVLKQCGLKKFWMVPSQSMPDNNFTTCPNPNPENIDCYKEALAYAESINPDLILATDPDADRLGVMIADDNGYKMLSGNEIGCLLLNYILESKKQRKTLPSRPVMIKTVVTSRMAEKIAASYNCEVKNLPVGFKYICEYIGYLKENNRIDDFIIGFEESNGYLCGNYTGDKDGILAAMLVCEMAAYYKKKKKNLGKQLESLYKQYGYYFDEIQDIVFDGLVGNQKMNLFLDDLHETPFLKLGDVKVTRIFDYLKKEDLLIDSGEKTNIDLPKNNMINFLFDNDCSLVIRPSGTEPKLKIYYSVISDNQDRGKQILANMKSAVQDIVNSYL